MNPARRAAAEAKQFRGRYRPVQRSKSLSRPFQVDSACFPSVRATGRADFFLLLDASPGVGRHYFFCFDRCRLLGAHVPLHRPAVALAFPQHLNGGDGLRTDFLPQIRAYGGIRGDGLALLASFLPAEWFGPASVVPSNCLEGMARGRGLCHQR